MDFEGVEYLIDGEVVAGTYTVHTSAPATTRATATKRTMIGGPDAGSALL